VDSDPWMVGLISADKAAPLAVATDPLTVTSPMGWINKASDRSDRLTA
jgi:hypothetical protein